MLGWHSYCLLLLPLSMLGLLLLQQSGTEGLALSPCACFASSLPAGNCPQMHCLVFVCQACAVSQCHHSHELSNSIFLLFHVSFSTSHTSKILSSGKLGIFIFFFLFSYNPCKFNQFACQLLGNFLHNDFFSFCTFYKLFFFFYYLLSPEMVIHRASCFITYKL